MKRICNCEICSHSMDRVGYKKYRKWNARYISKLKKDLKRLKDKGIRHGKLCSENKDEHIFACLLDSLTHAICISHECRMLKKSRKNSIK